LLRARCRSLKRGPSSLEPPHNLDRGTLQDRLRQCGPQGFVQPSHFAERCPAVGQAEAELPALSSVIGPTPSSEYVNIHAISFRMINAHSPGCNPWPGHSHAGGRKPLRVDRCTPHDRLRLVSSTA
jgi:hypothetical protein